MLRILTLNVLSDGSAGERSPYIGKIAETHKPDVICLQECGKGHHLSTLPLLQAFTVADALHNDGKTRVYTPILFRTDRLTKLGSGVEWLDSRYTATNTKSLAWAVFRDNTDGSVFGVLNVHVSLWVKNYPLPEGKTYEEMRTESVNWKIDNIAQMNRRMLAVCDKYGKLPVVWTGDFNFGKTAPAYTAIVDEYGMSDSELTATESRMPGYTFHPVGSPPAEDRDSIDHIFGNSSVEFVTHAVGRSEDDLKASDHCPVYTDIGFIKQ